MYRLYTIPVNIPTGFQILFGFNFKTQEQVNKTFYSEKQNRQK